MLFLRDIAKFETELGKLWIAGTIGTHKRPFTKEVIQNSSISDMAASVSNLRRSLPFRFLGSFFYGVCLVYDQKIHFLYLEVTACYYKVICKHEEKILVRRKLRKRKSINRNCHELQTVIQEVQIALPDKDIPMLSESVDIQTHKEKEQDSIYLSSAGRDPMLNIGNESFEEGSLLTIFRKSEDLPYNNYFDKLLINPEEQQNDENVEMNGKISLNEKTPSPISRRGSALDADSLESIKNSRNRRLHFPFHPLRKTGSNQSKAKRNSFLILDSKTTVSERMQQRWKRRTETFSPKSFYNSSSGNMVMTRGKWVVGRLAKLKLQCVDFEGDLRVEKRELGSKEKLDNLNQINGLVESESEFEQIEKLRGVFSVNQSVINNAAEFQKSSWVGARSMIPRDSSVDTGSSGANNRRPSRLTISSLGTSPVEVNRKSSAHSSHAAISTEGIISFERGRILSGKTDELASFKASSVYGLKSPSNSLTSASIFNRGSIYNSESSFNMESWKFLVLIEDFLQHKRTKYEISRTEISPSEAQRKFIYNDTVYVTFQELVPPYAADSSLAARSLYHLLVLASVGSVCINQENVSSSIIITQNERRRNSFDNETPEIIKSRLGKELASGASFQLLRTPSQIPVVLG